MSNQHNKWSVVYARKRMHIVGSNGLPIATAGYRASPLARADAALMASAPELLAALKELLNQSLTNDATRGERRSNERINMTSAAHLMAERAIAKAKGSDA